MIKVTVEFDHEDGIEEGTFLLQMEKELRHCYPLLDVRVFKAKKRDDSLLRLKRTA